MQSHLESNDMVMQIHLSIYVVSAIQKTVSGCCQGLERGRNGKVLVKTSKVSVIQNEKVLGIYFIARSL